MWCKYLTVRTIVAEKFDGDGIWNVGTRNEGNWGRLRGGKQVERGWKRICDLSRKVLRLKSEDAAT
jgi:hypothetical protein